MAVKPTVLESKVVAKSRLFTVEELQLRFSNGQERVFERLIGRSTDSVMIVPMLDDDTLLLVREYAAGFDEYYLSFPMGAVSPGEDYLHAADRELKEEVGFGANKLHELSALSSSPSYTTRQMRIILAQDLYPEKLEGDEPEPLEVVQWPLSNYKELIARPDFHVSNSFAALFLLQEYLNAN